MKTILYTLAFLVIGFSSVQGQSNDSKQKWEKITQLKIEFVSKKLNLSESDKNQFLPIYKKYQTEIDQLFHEKRLARQDNKNNPEKQVEDDLRLDEKYIYIKKSYLKEFQKVLSPTQIKTMYSAEREFKEELFKHLKEHNSKSK